ASFSPVVGTTSIESRCLHGCDPSHLLFGRDALPSSSQVLTRLPPFTAGSPPVYRPGSPAGSKGARRTGTDFVHLPGWRPTSKVTTTPYFETPKTKVAIASMTETS